MIKDLYLRKNMDNEGWVNLKLILDFKRVKIIINGLLNGLEKEKKEGEEKKEKLMSLLLLMIIMIRLFWKVSNHVRI